MIAPDASLPGSAEAARLSLRGDDRCRPAGGAGLSQDTPRQPDDRCPHLPGDGPVGGLWLGTGLLYLPLHRMHLAV